MSKRPFQESKLDEAATARLPTTPKLFSDEKRKFITEEIRTARITVGGRPRSVVHVRLDVVEVQTRMDYDGEWVFSDRNLERAYDAAVRKYDTERDNSRENSGGRDRGDVEIVE